MSTRANITSVEAIQAFRANLIVYIARARSTLDEISSQVNQTRNWVRVEQRNHWMEIMKRRSRALEEARAALFSAKLSNLKEASAAEIKNVTKARLAFEEAEQKLRVVRNWDRDYDNRTDPQVKLLDKLQTILADDLSRAVIYLANVVKTLDEYSGMVAPSIGVAEGAPKDFSSESPLPSEPAPVQNADAPAAGVETGKEAAK